MLGILSVLIIVHECGHFSVARLFGFQTPVFGFGLPFGPHWVVGRKWGTEFRIHACLLGGYVAIPELGDESNASADAFGVPLLPFHKFPIWQRALVAFAGVGFNMLFAYLVMFVMLVTHGQPMQQTSVQQLIKDNPIAANAGIKVDDVILAVNDSPITGPDDAVHHISSHKHETVHISIKRHDQPMMIDVTTNDAGKVGMALVPSGPITYKPVTGNFFEVAQLSFTRLCNLTFGMLDNLGQMIGGLFSGAKGGAGGPKLGFQDLHGVLAVVIIGQNIASSDWSQLFLFTILISMDLAIVNLVPWPALDGGHLAFMFFEAIRGKPMGERAQGEIVKWGFLSLIALMVVIMVNDVTAWMQGKLDFKKDDGKQTQKKDGATTTTTNTTTDEKQGAPNAINPDAAPAGPAPAAPAPTTSPTVTAPAAPAQKP